VWGRLGIGGLAWMLEISVLEGIGDDCLAVDGRALRPPEGAWEKEVSLAAGRARRGTSGVVVRWALSMGPRATVLEEECVRIGLGAAEDGRCGIREGAGRADGRLGLAVFGRGRGTEVWALKGLKTAECGRWVEAAGAGDAWGMLRRGTG
jgi:hypothetical protein